ncbi:MAG: thioredoxin family protein [Flavobacterium sp.]|nr:thioredoxin family protein [Flavobacterium sp.]
MKKLVLALLLIGGMSISAQENLKWHTDMKEAIAISKSENKPLFLFFTGSDWCGWCIRLQKEVFNTPEFLAWSEKVVMVDLDFPRAKAQPEAIKAQNQQLQQVFQVRGYPTVWFAKEGVTADGKTNLEQLGSTGYVAGGSGKWLEGANQIIAKFTPYPTMSKKEMKAKKKQLKVKKAA